MDSNAKVGRDSDTLCGFIVNSNGQTRITVTRNSSTYVLQMI